MAQRIDFVKVCTEYSDTLTEYFATEYTLNGTLDREIKMQLQADEKYVKVFSDYQILITKQIAHVKQLDELTQLKTQAALKVDALLDEKSQLLPLGKAAVQDRRRDSNHGLFSSADQRFTEFTAARTAYITNSDPNTFHRYFVSYQAFLKTIQKKKMLETEKKLLPADAKEIGIVLKEQSDGSELQNDINKLNRAMEKHKAAAEEAASKSKFVIATQVCFARAELKYYDTLHTLKLQEEKDCKQMNPVLQKLHAHLKQVLAAKVTAAEAIKMLDAKLAPDEANAISSDLKAMACIVRKDKAYDVFSDEEKLALLQQSHTSFFYQRDQKTIAVLLAVHQMLTQITPSPVTQLLLHLENSSARLKKLRAPLDAKIIQSLNKTIHEIYDAKPEAEFLLKLKNDFGLHLGIELTSKEMLMIGEQFQYQHQLPPVVSRYLPGNISITSKVTKFLSAVPVANLIQQLSVALKTFTFADEKAEKAALADHLANLDIKATDKMIKNIYKKQKEAKLEAAIASKTVTGTPSQSTMFTRTSQASTSSLSGSPAGSNASPQTVSAFKLDG